MFDHAVIADIDLPPFGVLSIVFGDMKPMRRRGARHAVAAWIEAAGKWAARTSRLLSKWVRGPEAWAR